MPVKIGVLVSGSGTNLQSIIESCESERFAEIAVVISNRTDAYALKRAESRGIPTRVISHKDYPDRKIYDRELVRVLNEFDVELVTLAGFMRVLTSDFLKAFPGRVMNIHPALLPSFPGLEVRQAAIDYGVRFSGCTVHFVDEGVDTGPIIIQAAVPVFPEDTEEELKNRILMQEHRIYPEAIRMYAQGRLRVEGRKVFIEGTEKNDSQWMINPSI